jgi:hypothetical protein
MDSHILNIINQYFTNTSKEQQKRDWERIEKMRLRGPNVFKYMETVFGFEFAPPPKEKEINFNNIEQAPKFIGACFFSLGLHYDYAKTSQLSIK